MMRAVIVDDEELARYSIRQVLEREGGVEVVGEAAHGAEAVAMIPALDPDLVFLDVQMPGADGFDVIERIGAERMPPVIFVTAFDAFALQAFEAQADCFRIGLCSTSPPGCLQQIVLDIERLLHTDECAISVWRNAHTTCG